MTGTASFRALAPAEVSNAIRTEWDNWTRAEQSPFTLPAFFDAWCRAFGDERRGFVVVGFTGGAPAMLLPCWHAHATPANWQGLGSHRADYTEAAAAPGASSIFASFWRWLWLEAPCRSAKLARMPSESLLARAVPSRAFARTGRAVAGMRSMLRARRVRYLSADIAREHPFAGPARIEALADRLESRDTKRKLGALRKHGPVAYEAVHGARALRLLLPQFFAMHVAAFAATGRQSQFSLASERAFYEALVDAPGLDGVVCMDVLRVGDRPVAMHLGFQRGATLYWYKPTYDVELEKMSPGRILLAHVFARAAAQGVRCVDLLKGTEAYKDDWASSVRPTITTSLVERSPLELVSRIGARCE